MSLQCALRFNTQMHQVKSKTECATPITPILPAPDCTSPPSRRSYLRLTARHFCDCRWAATKFLTPFASPTGKTPRPCRSSIIYIIGIMKPKIVIGRDHEPARALIGLEAFRGANQKTEYIYDSQWEGRVFLPANQKKPQRGRGQILVSLI